MEVLLIYITGNNLCLNFIGDYLSLAHSRHPLVEDAFAHSANTTPFIGQPDDIIVD